MENPKSTIRQATMDTYYADGSAPAFGDECEVLLTPDELVISYLADTHVVYRGKAIGSGHYELFSEEEGGRAVMHGVPGGSLLVGCWRVGMDSGVWKVEISPKE